MINFIFYHTPLFYLIQSIWRDEAFSYFMAKPDLFKVITNTVSDFNPPFYYLILHYWISVFGKWDEMLRMLSFIPHLLTVYIAYKFAQELFSKKFAFFVAIFTFLNPMLLYYAFEMRMYSFYALFTIGSLYFFYKKRWIWYTIITVLGLYTHSFFPLIIASYILYLKLIKNLEKKIFINTIKPILFYIPWIPVIIVQFFHSKDSWMFPVDRQLILSALGNIFTNYEGTPGNWWPYTAILSLFMILFIGFAFYKNRNHPSKIKTVLLFTVPIFLPLFLILGFSVIRRPIYVNRYLIFVSVFEIMVITYAASSIANKLIKKIIILFLLLFVIFFNIAITPYHKKTDFKNIFAEINKSSSSIDYVYSKTPIGFLESAYYYKYPDHAYVYNPKNIQIPNYIGVNIVYPDVSSPFFPKFPSKTYLVGDDADYTLIINQ